MGRKKPPVNDNRLLTLIERIERLEEDKREVAEAIGEIYQEAKSAGFELKYVRLMIKERRMTNDQREEERALADIYRAALGMLDGTPLGEAARARLTRPPEPPPPPSNEGDDTEAAADAEQAAEPAEQLQLPDLPAPPSAEEIATARAEGAEAARAGQSVMANPYPAGSRLRGAWDEGWCGASGSDGMEIPAAFRRNTRKPSNQGEASP